MTIPFDCPPPRRMSKAFAWAIAISVLGAIVLFALLLFAVQAALEAGRWAQCNGHLKQLGVALHNYHSQNGCFPPPYIADESGNPMHSWRVLLLPYMGCQDLYDRYRFDEPWNSPHNRELERNMPPVLRCPSAQSKSGNTNTSYVAVIGPGLLFDPARVNRIADVANGLSNTIAIVESTGPQGAGIPWMAPADLDLDTMNPVINGIPGPAIASTHAHGAGILTADGAAHFIKEGISAQTLRAMLTIAGDDVDPSTGTSVVEEMFYRSDVRN